MWLIEPHVSVEKMSCELHFYFVVLRQRHFLSQTLYHTFVTALRIELIVTEQVIGLAAHMCKILHIWKSC